MSPRGVPNPRSAKAVIDAALAENRFWEYTCFGLIVAFALVAVGALVTAVVRGEWTFVAGGLGASGIVWRSLEHAMLIRRQNVATRLIEVPLSKATTVDEASRILSGVAEQWRTKP